MDPHSAFLSPAPLHSAGALYRGGRNAAHSAHSVIRLDSGMPCLACGRRSHSGRKPVRARRRAAIEVNKRLTAPAGAVTPDASELATGQRCRASGWSHRAFRRAGRSRTWPMSNAPSGDSSPGRATLALSAIRSRIQAVPGSPRRPAGLHCSCPAPGAAVPPVVVMVLVTRPGLVSWPGHGWVPAGSTRQHDHQAPHPPLRLWKKGTRQVSGNNAVPGGSYRT